MSTTTEQISLKSFMFYALLWLPLAFFIWFYLASFFVAPVALFLDWLLPALMPQLFDAVSQQGYTLDMETLIALPPAMVGGREGALATISVNPMIYGYGLPLFAGLIMAAPGRTRIQLLQILLGWVVICLVQCWGVSWRALKVLAFDMGEQISASVPLPNEVIALGYQLGYLILPALVPVVLWIALNPGFLRLLVERRTEP